MAELFLAGFADTPGGVTQLRLWIEHWSKGRIAPEVIDIWSSQVVAPKHCGHRVENPSRRKIRAIALEEAPVKLAESISIDAVVHEVLKQLEPIQLGAGTADGTVLIVGILRRWAAEAMEQAVPLEGDLTDEDIQELEAIFSTDFMNE